MNKKLGRALNADVWPLFLVLVAFAIATAFFGQYVLALIELVITGLSFAGYMFYRSYRRKQLQSFIQKNTDLQIGVSGAASPFPTALIRLHDGGIVYADDAFAGCAEGFVIIAPAGSYAEAYAAAHGYTE